VTLNNGLRALLISDPSLPKNGERLAETKVSVSSCKQEEISSQCTDVEVGAVAASDDGDSSWTDVSSDGCSSESSEHDSKALDSADSCSGMKRASEKKRSQHSHSAPSLQTCGGEKLVNIVRYCVKGF